jgi:hypothetical protein
MDSYRPITTGEVRSFLFSFLHFVKRCLQYLLRATRSNLVVVLLVAGLCFTAGFMKFGNQPSYYESTMVCSFNTLHKKTFGEMVHRLDDLAKTGSYSRLAQLLGVDTTQAKRIIGFDDRNVAGSPLHEDVTTEKLPMYFTLRSTDPGIFKDVEKGLMNYLNNQPYLQLRNSLDQQAIHQRINFYDTASAKIGKLIDAYTTFLSGSGPGSDTASGFANVVDIFRHQEELENKKIAAYKELGLTQSVEIIYGFAPADHPASAGSLRWLVLALASICLGIFVAVVKQLLQDGR